MQTLRYLSCNVAFSCLMFVSEISNRMVFVNGKHPKSQIFLGEEGYVDLFSVGL